LAEAQTVIRTLRGVQTSLVLGEALVRPAPLEPKGAVYTKPWVVNLLLDLAGYVATQDLGSAVAVEPAAGDGAFLRPMIERLAQSCKRFGRPISECRGAIIAYELDEASAVRARSLAETVLRDLEIPSATARNLAGIWIRSGDYLLDPVAVEADFVIGNPPYVRMEEIPEDTALLYREAYATMRGRADLYVGFFEAALLQLKDGGTCAFICADRWMRNQYGAELRKLITSEFGVDVVIEMHNADAFDDVVDAYPAITVIRRQKQGRTIVASAGPESAHLPAGRLAASLRDSLNSERVELSAGFHVARVDTWFKGSDPWPCRSPEQLALLRRLEDEFQPLESNARVGIGVATGNDSVFVTTDSGLVEASRLLKIAMARDIRSGALKWSGHYLVNPWNGRGLVDLAKYPRLGAYFEAHESALKKRHTAIKSAHAWYKTIDRVTHALTTQPKLYIADIKDVLDPVLDDGTTYPHHNLYFIQSDLWDLEVLGGLLISAVGQFFVESYGVRMRGGYLRFQAQYLRRIRTPDPANISKSHAEGLVAAFRTRDRDLATRLALTIYGIGKRELETAIGH